MKALLSLSIESVAQGERQTTVERCTGIADSVDPTSVVLSRLGIGVSGSDCINQESARRFVVACEWTKEQRRGKERLLDILHCSTTLGVFPKLKKREREKGKIYKMDAILSNYDLSLQY